MDMKVSLYRVSRALGGKSRAHTALLERLCRWGDVIRIHRAGGVRRIHGKDVMLLFARYHLWRARPKRRKLHACNRLDSARTKLS